MVDSWQCNHNTIYYIINRPLICASVCNPLCQSLFFAEQLTSLSFFLLKASVLRFSEWSFVYESVYPPSGKSDFSLISIVYQLIRTLQTSEFLAEVIEGDGKIVGKISMNRER
jgi:hypothetical protein